MFRISSLDQKRPFAGRAEGQCLRECDYWHPASFAGLMRALDDSPCLPRSFVSTAASGPFRSVR